MWTSNSEGLEIKSLHITIRDEDGGSLAPPARYGVWTSGQGPPQRERSSRLVVKVLNDASGVSDLNLDLCAQRFEGNDDERSKEPCNLTAPFTQDDDFFCQTSSKLHNAETGSTTSNDTDKSPISNMWEGQNNSASKQSEVKPPHENRRIKSVADYFYKNNAYNVVENENTSEKSEGNEAFSNPLDYSLKKVHANNILIMKGIEMINRILNYTKPLENVFPLQVEGRFECNVCGKVFAYESGLRSHRARHAGGVGGHAWQSVWTCGSCFQVWPRRELLVKHSKFCCIGAKDLDTREIKTSSLLQCEFCEKVFTSIPRLATHSRNHTSNRNYECSPCDAGFPSYRLAEQHWHECAWLQQSYNFILQKMFVCNVCDRKFQKYEQLYNHRYKAEHFATKTQSTKSGEGQLQMTVYQCELCGQAMPSEKHLQRHRLRLHIPDYLTPTYKQEHEEIPDKNFLKTDCQIHESEFKGLQNL